LDLEDDGVVEIYFIQKTLNNFLGSTLALTSMTLRTMYSVSYLVGMSTRWRKEQGRGHLLSRKLPDYVTHYQKDQYPTGRVQLHMDRKRDGPWLRWPENIC
jgi:hypothetical protein